MQTLDLTEIQVNWAINHFGHTLDVHSIHYRLTSADIERTQIAKMLLLQDHQQVSKYANCRLSDIDLKDIVFPDPGSVGCSSDWIQSCPQPLTKQPRHHLKTSKS